MLLEPRSPENLGNLQIHCVEGIHFKWGSRRDQGQNDRYMMSGNWWTLMRGLPLKNSFNAALLTLHMVQERQSFRSAAQILLWLMQGRNEVRWRPGQEASLAPSCSNLKPFGSKFTVFEEVQYLWHCWDFSPPTELCPPASLVTTLGWWYILVDRLQLKQLILLRCKMSFIRRSQQTEVSDLLYLSFGVASSHKALFSCDPCKLACCGRQLKESKFLFGFSRKNKLIEACVARGLRQGKALSSKQAQ